jgi:hypothetical protein
MDQFFCNVTHGPPHLTTELLKAFVDLRRDLQLNLLRVLGGIKPEGLVAHGTSAGLAYADSA